ncbi:MAG TPA: toll/interleukin-1 receptor domain-containing protein [Chthoniobacteraceae bacterium]|nr:toll/interleukin-1 receptor domain-containing protein [Chthoniobacteraceae bacterium]
MVPILGQDLLRVTAEGVETTFPRLLAKRLASSLGVDGDPGDLHRLVTEQLGRNRPRLEITRALSKVHEQALRDVAIPEPLRQLAEVTDFPLLISTTTDRLLTRALTEGSRAPSSLAATFDRKPDLPAGWENDPAPLVFHLFGQISATPGYAITEEDTLEFLHQLHDPVQPRLFDSLKKRHLLFLGNSFPDWLARVFYRVLRGRRISVQGETFDAVADECVRGGKDKALVLFLREFAISAMLFEEGGVVEFVSELHGRWKAAAQSTVAVAPLDGYEADDMVPGSIFISYRSLDRAAAFALAAALKGGGLEVWLDQYRLETGDPFERKIRHHIRHCDLFVPLISRNTEKADESFFRREWRWAIKRAEAMHGRRFIMPVLVDRLETDALQRVDDEILSVTISEAIDGIPSPKLVEEFVAAIRELRARKS